MEHYLPWAQGVPTVFINLPKSSPTAQKSVRDVTEDFPETTIYNLNNRGPFNKSTVINFTQRCYYA